MSESGETERSSGADREELQRILGYDSQALRILNVLTEHGIHGYADLRRTTYAELAELPGIGRARHDRIVAGLEHYESTRKEGR
ncbi:helix-hairpin-helix domain-containing protein [Streptomyces sp. NPDC058947]|uniref:helix-hairpin-helix domain-containing protein n=1 Tax=Streptomyces sp. NPDC058947 TaxID=3346675 RepID=UPI00368D25AE